MSDVLHAARERQDANASSPELFWRLSVATLALVPSLAWAQASQSLDEEIVVTATRSARSLHDVPASVSVVTAQTIQDSPAQTLDRILVRTPSIDLPNISSNQMHPTDGRVSMRGLGGIRALVMLDGVPINDPFFGYLQWSRVPLENIERVEIVRGGGAALWGNYAMGGVINILTRTPQENELILQGAGGSYGTYRLNGFGSLVASDNVRLSLSAGRDHTDGFMQVEPADRGPIHVPTSFTSNNATLRGDFDLTPTLQARATVDYFDTDQHLITRLSRNEQTAWTYTGGLTQHLGSNSALDLTLFGSDSRFTTWNTGAFDAIPANEAEYVQNLHRTPVNDFGGSLVWSQNFDAGLLRAVELGVDYHTLDGKDRAQIFDETGTLERVDIGSGKQNFWGAFAQTSIRPIDPLEILASVRYQTFRNYDAFDGTPGGLGHAPDTTEDSVDPRISLRYALSSSVALRAAAYTAFRAPNFDNLYRAFSVPAGIFYANPSLTPERLKGGEVGFDVNTASLRFQATAYYNDIDDLITFRVLDDSELPPGFFFGSRNINAGKARSQGAEVEADWTISSGWSARLGYTFADSQITENALDPASVGQQIGGVPRNRANLAVTYQSPAGWRITPQLRWIEASFADNDHTLPVDQQTVVDLAASTPVARNVEAYLNIENLFDTHYIADNGGFNPPLRGTPFSALLGVRVRLH